MTHFFYLIMIYLMNSNKEIMFVEQTGVELELVDSQPLLEWFANNYKTFGE